MLETNEIKSLIFYFLNLLNFVLPRKRVAILLYHNVAKNDVHFTISPERFIEQMRYLNDNGYHVISLVELIADIKLGKIFKAKTVVLTFDDGYKGHLQNAIPAIKKYGFPATFFVATDFSKREMASDGGKMQELLDEQGIFELSQYVKAEIAPHSVSHRELIWIEKKEAEEEIRKSKIDIEKLTNKNSYSFAYPRGYYNKEIIQMLKVEGIECAVTINQGLVSGNTNLFELPRNTVNRNAGLEEFKGCLNYSSLIFEILTNFRKFLRRFKKNDYV